MIALRLTIILLLSLSAGIILSHNMSDGIVGGIFIASAAINVVLLAREDRRHDP